MSVNVCAYSTLSIQSINVYNIILYDMLIVIVEFIRCWAFSTLGISKKI